MPIILRDALSDPELRGLKPEAMRYDVRDGLTRGLILSVLPSGRKQWSLRYRTQGRHRRLVLGEFPAMLLAKARKTAEKAREHARDGRDLVAERVAAKAVRTDTVATLAADYLEQHAEKRKRTGAHDRRMLDVDVLPFWRERSVRAITRRDVRDVLDRIVKRGAPIAANRTLEVIRKMFNWGIQHDWLDGNPAAQIEKPGIEQSRDRVLTDDEIRALWALLGRVPSKAEKQAPGRKRATVGTDGAFCPISPALAAVQKLRLLTAQRGGEIVNMRWADVDLDTGWWTIPAEHSKNGQPHRVFLTPTARAIVKAQPQPDGAVAVFTGRKGALVDERVKKAGAALSKALGFEFRSHDLRRTAATRMAAAGVPREHISAVLNHVQGGAVATRVYDRYNYDAEKRAALDVWDRTLSRLLVGKATGADVVSIRHGRR